MTISSHAAMHQAVIYGKVVKMIFNNHIGRGGILRIAIGTLLVFLVFSGWASAAETTLLTDNFESYTSGIWPSSGGWEQFWNVNSDPSNNKVTNQYSSGGSNSLQIYGAHSDCWGAMTRKSVTLPKQFYVEASMMASGDAFTSGSCHSWAGDLWMSIGDGLGGTGESVLLRFYKDSNFRAVGESLLSSYGQYNTMNWYNIKMKVDLDAGTVDYWINNNYAGQKFSQDLKDRITTNSYLAVGSGGGRGWIDNVKVYTNTDNDVNDVEAKISNIWGSSHPILLFGQSTALGQAASANLDSSPVSEPLPSYPVCLGPRNSDKSVISRFTISDTKVKIVADITGGTGYYPGSQGYIKITNPEWKITDIIQTSIEGTGNWVMATNYQGTGTGVTVDKDNGIITWFGRGGCPACACHENGLHMEFIVEKISSSPIESISTIWEDETDKMIVPYDQVKFKFTFKNNLPTRIKNIKLTFNSKVDVPITFESEKEYNNVVLPGGQFDIYNLMNIKGVDNAKIYNDIISTINGKIDLTKSIKVKITYDTDTETGLDGENLDISPTDESGTVLSIQYPNFKKKVGDPIPKDDVGDYYLKGDDDFSHLTDVLVRKYAVKAAAYYTGTFQDDPATVSFSVFRYIDDKLEWDNGGGNQENDAWITSKLEDTYEEKGWICITHAYLFTSFERSLGFPSREITVGELFPTSGLVSLYDQNGAAEIWHSGRWNFYDLWTSRRPPFTNQNDDILSFDDLLTKTNILKYKAWNAFDKQTSIAYKGSFTQTEYEGHKFGISPFDGAPNLLHRYQWKKRAEGASSSISNVIVAGSPIKMLVKDNQGRMVGSTNGGIVNEIPGAKYMPPGQIGYSQSGDPSTAFELDEFISLPDGLNGKYELIVTGTGDGAYTLQFAKFDPISENEYSGVTTLKETIKKDQVLRYEVNIDGSTISPVLPGDINGDGKLTLVDAIYLAKHVGGFSGYETISAGGDINGNGQVTLVDAIYLAKHVGGFIGYEKIY